MAVRSNRSGACPKRAARLLSVLLVLVAITTGVATAAEYEGAGNTGWIWDNKRDCCSDAVLLAQEDSAAKCRAAGGTARIREGARRGMCEWEAQGDTDNVLYRCTATSYVACWP